MRSKRVLVALVVVLAALGAAPRADGRAGPTRVLLLGDSLAWEARDYFGFFGGLAGFDVRERTRGGTAICDWFAELEGDLDAFGPDVVVAAFSGNAITPCMRDRDGRSLAGRAYDAKYRADVSRVMDRAGSVPVIWVGPPAGAAEEPAGTGVDEVYRTASARWAGARYVDGGALITPGRRWSGTQPCLWFEPCSGPTVDGVRHNVVRAWDTAHFCPAPLPAVDGVVPPCPVFSSGALRYALTMLGAVQDLT